MPIILVSELMQEITLCLRRNMPLSKLKFRPGINREITAYSNEGGWTDGDKIRFRFGFPEKIGGWSKYSGNTYLGTARRLHDWVSLDGSQYVGIGTNLKYYIEEGGTYNDITPTRGGAQALGSNPITTATSTNTNVASGVTYAVTVVGGVYYIDGASKPSLTLTRGVTYTFDLSNASNSGHPLAFQDSGGSSYTTGVTNNYASNAPGTSGSQVVIVVSTSAPYPANYYCTVHGTGMGNTITTVASGGGTPQTTLTISDTNHGAVENDFVILAGATTTNGVSASTINAEHQITEIIDGSSYKIIVDATASGSGAGGGGSVTATYQINTGLDSGVGGTGFGGGVWGGQLTSAQTNTINMGSGLSATATTITLTSSTGFPTSGIVLIDTELITYTGISTNDLTGCVRGMYLTTASTHANGATVTDATTGWGMPSNTTTTAELRTWSHDNFGEDLIINPRDSGIYYWDRSLGLSARAVELSSLGGASQTPTVAKQVMISDNDRHVICFGTNTYGTSVQDPLMIRWSQQADPANWTISSTTTAGSLRLGSGSEFVQAVETKREILVWTDTSLFSMRFIGAPLIFGLQSLASNITIVGPKSAVATEDVVFWMGIDNFYIYSGQTQQLPCAVKDKVFNDFNSLQKEKVVAGVNSEFGEIIWFYPSETNSIANGGTGDNDKYVIYNYLEKVWYYGDLARTAWLDRGIKSFPIGAGTNNYLYNHEFGYDDDGSPINSFIESAPMDIGDGDKFSLISKIIPDLTFNGSTNLSNPSATFSIKTRNFPGINFHETSSGVATRTSVNPIEQFTKELFVRARGRSFAMRIDSSALGMKWKLGSPRVEIKPDGRR
jgi:hypothetical protein